MMLADALEAVGIERGDYVIRVNNRKVLNGVLEVAGLAEEDAQHERGIVLRAIDKLDRLGPWTALKRCFWARVGRMTAGTSPKVPD